MESIHTNYRGYIVYIDFIWINKGFRFLSHSPKTWILNLNTILNIKVHVRLKSVMCMYNILVFVFRRDKSQRDTNGIINGEHETKRTVSKHLGK